MKKWSDCSLHELQELLVDTEENIHMSVVYSDGNVVPKHWGLIVDVYENSRFCGVVFRPYTWGTHKHPFTIPLFNRKRGIINIRRMDNTILYRNDEVEGVYKGDKPSGNALQQLLLPHSYVNL